MSGKEYWGKPHEQAAIELGLSPTARKLWWWCLWKTKGVGEIWLDLKEFEADEVKAGRQPYDPRTLKRAFAQLCDRGVLIIRKQCGWRHADCLICSVFQLGIDSQNSGIDAEKIGSNQVIPPAGDNNNSKDINQDKRELERVLIDFASKPGMSAIAGYQIRQFDTLMGRDYFEQQLNYVLWRVGRGSDIEDLPAYLFKALENDYAASSMAFLRWSQPGSFGIVSTLVDAAKQIAENRQ